MSRRQFKSQASSSRAAPPGGFGGGFVSSSFGSASSALSYLSEQPDLKSITDPNVVVNFKNLSKKDGTTKTKALEELQIYVLSLQESQCELEEPFIDAWVKVFPRVTIDLSRRVRQEVHTLNGHVCLSSGKRIARHMPDVIGAWIAGLHDGDKPVMRAAQEALQRVFTTQEKQASLTKVYHASILRFAMNAIQETPGSLSDDRTTTREDADAKFARVFSSNIAVIDSLLNTLSDKEIEKQENLYQECIDSEQRWTTIASPDSGVRRSTLRLLQTVLVKRKYWLAGCLTSLCNEMFSKQAVSNQSGSSLEFTNTLLVLSNSFPSIWEASAERNNSIMRLGELAKTGSQGAPSHYWDNVSKVFSSVPTAALPTSKEQIYKLLKQVHSGIIRKDEPRSHAESAWNCYIQVIEILGNQLEKLEHRTLLKDLLFPLVQQYLKPEVVDSHWSVLGPRGAHVVSSALRSQSMYDVIEAEWPSVTRNMLQRIQTSLPEQSKDHQQSQTSLIAEGTRFFALENEMLKTNVPEALSKIILESTSRVMSESMVLLRARSGKPYGAAGVIDAGLRILESWLFRQPDIAASLASFISQDIPQLITSPSQKCLVSILYGCQNRTEFSEAWNSTLKSTLEIPDTPLKLTTLGLILSSPRMPHDFTQPAHNTALQNLILEQSDLSIEDGGDFAFVNDVVASPARIMSTETSKTMMLSIMEKIGAGVNASSALSALKIILQRDPDLLKTFLRGPNGSELMQNLLLLTETNDDDLAATAVEFNKTLERLLSDSQSSGMPSTSTVKILEHGLYETSISSLSIETLVELAQKSPQLLEVLPNSQKWSEILHPFLHNPPPSSLALTNALGGAIYLIDRSQDIRSPHRGQGDRDGYSAALRIALYVVRLLNKPSDLAGLGNQKCAEIYTLLLITAQLVNDKLSLHASNHLWTSDDSTTENEMLDFVSEVQVLLAGLRNTSTQATSERFFLDSTHEALFQASTGSGPSAFQNARAFAFSVSEFIEAVGWQQNGSLNLEETLKSLKRGTDVFSFTSFVVAYKARVSFTPGYTRICNELIAALTGDSLSKNSADALQKLVYLNLMLSDQDSIIDTIAKQRLIFFVKHVVSWLGSDTVNVSIKAETCKTMTILLPHMKDIYGTHWADVLTALVKDWKQENSLDITDLDSATIPWLQASMKLAATLRGLLSDEGANDDLRDAWNEAAPHLSSGLMHLLTQLGRFPDDFNQPLQIVNELLGRQIRFMPTTQTKHIEELYPLMGAASQRVQRIAFDLLHKQIPLLQEQVSIEAALDKSSARLPDEVLSLIIEAPTMESLAEASFTRTMPLSLQSYLSSWLLVFDHFKNASDKVKTDYVEHLKEGDYLSGLLNFTFDFLGHSSGKPIDASKFDITNYTFGVEESAMKDVQWLLIHLYFLSLKRTPALAKNWWMECKSRQTVVNVETWTEKYISPYVITDALTTVNEWAETQDATSDEAIIVKPNQRTKEILISKEIDDQLLSMVIRLPSNFPLGQAVLHGVNRVAVDEKRWRSWLLNSQGVITFSNNSLIDGIIAFRRNVVGALKGQTECAICYSIVGADKQLPTKRCGTCKNLFHGGCLYRWFKSSNSSSCPLCRNPFNYT